MVCNGISFYFFISGSPGDSLMDEQVRLIFVNN